MDANDPYPMISVFAEEHRRLRKRRSGSNHHADRNAFCLDSKYAS